MAAISELAWCVLTEMDFFESTLQNRSVFIIMMLPGQRVVETYVVAEEALKEVRLLGGDMVSPLYFLPLEGDRCRSVVRHDDYTKFKRK